MKSIFEPTMDWQPFAFSSLQRIGNNALECLAGDQTITNAVTNSASALRQAKPILKSLTYSEE